MKGELAPWRPFKELERMEEKWTTSGNPFLKRDRAGKLRS